MFYCFQKVLKWIKKLNFAWLKNFLSFICLGYLYYKHYSHTSHFYRSVLLKRGNFGHTRILFKSDFGLEIVGRHTYCDERPFFPLNLAILKTVLESWNPGHSEVKKNIFFSPSNILHVLYVYVELCLRGGKYMACCLLYRGDVVPKVVFFFLLFLTTYQVKIKYRTSIHTEPAVQLILALN